jgi:bifunctional non-homologous end joining protein LigD
MPVSSSPSDTFLAHQERIKGVHPFEGRSEQKLVAEVDLRGWTADGLLRHASFKGLREDKEPEEVVRECVPTSQGRAGASLPGFHLTHPDRVLWPDVGLTKQGLAEFYTEIAGWILPHVVGRPLALVR